jgi:phospholipid-transporting ATPase
MPRNMITTAKYSVINFIPKNLMNQFKKLPNCYFLLICYLQTIPLISISANKPVMAFPLVVIVIISMLKDAFEDFQRHKSDKQENNTTSLALDINKFDWTPRCWKDIRVGEIIKVRDDEFAPADLLILASSDVKGVCYVETKNLDGETNLKIKNVHKDVNGNLSSIEQLVNLEGEMMCERPNGALYKFEGQAKFNFKREKIPINPENIILRGSSLKNTDFVYGITVFTGHDSKVMMNSTQAKYKFSKLEILVNKSMFIVFGLQIVLALIAAFLGNAWISTYNKANWSDLNCYVNLSERSSDCDNAYYVMFNVNKLGFLALFGTWILIFTNFVPISLMVTLEMVKLGQAIMM